MSTFYHNNISELRKRTVFCMLFFGILFCLCYHYSALILDFLLYYNKPDTTTLFTQKITSPFFIKIKISFYSAIIPSMQIILYNIYRFISLGMFKKERNIILPFVLISPLLGAIGVATSIFFISPLSIDFFNGINITSTINVVKMIDVETMLSLIITMSICCFIVFQIPIAIYYLMVFGILTPQRYSVFRKFYIPIYLFIGAILTPPDVVSQVICTAIMIILTEIAYFWFMISQYIKNKG
jgi:sec-independent protein translocase protein TatC